MKMNFQRFAFLLLALFVFPNFTNAQYLASDLLGQLDGSNNPVYTTGSGGLSDRKFSQPRGIVLDTVHHRLFTVDRNQRRVLVFNLDENNDLIDRIADYVLGQTTFDVVVSATTQSNFLNQIQGITYDSDNDRLFVTDLSNNRILVFETSTITNGMNASYVLGQTDFVTNTPLTTQNGMRSPGGIEYDHENNRIFVADQGNNRILVFDTSTITNGMNASYVLGQTDFVTATAATTQSGMNAPSSALVYDTENNRLFVQDGGNRRILVFDVSTITNGMNASYVLGQIDFTSNSSSVSQNGLSTILGGLAYNSTNNTLLFGDTGFNRALIYNVTSSVLANGQNAIAVLGQPDFTTSTATTTQSGFNLSGLADFDISKNRVYISDLSNHRVMIFNFIRITTESLPISSILANTVYTAHTIATTNSQGTVSYAITSGSLPTGLSLNTSTGEISGTPTVAGSYNFTVQATDDNGAIGYFLSQPQEYTLEVNEPRSNTSGSRPTRARTTIVPVATEPVFNIPTAQVVELTTPSTTNYTFTRTLRIKDSGEDVKELQKYLNTHGYPVAITGPGSLGNETNYFGLLTHAAVMKFQIANKLIGDGIVGPLTKTFLK